jgi:hypothetical protein
MAAAAFSPRILRFASNPTERFAAPTRWLMAAETDPRRGYQMRFLSGGYWSGTPGWVPDSGPAPWREAEHKRGRCGINIKPS